MKKDWRGNKTSVMKTLGADAGQRESKDYYATHPDAVRKLLEEENFNKYVWECACLDEETEFFNGYVWKKISDFCENDMVLICDENGVSKLEKPISFIKTKSNLLYEYKSNYLDMSLSSGHRVLYKNNHGKLKVRNIEEIVEKHEKSVNGFKAKIPISFTYDGTLTVDENLLRIAVAVQADGRIRSNTNYIEFRVKKQRKKERIEFLLKQANIDYKVNHKSNGYSEYYFYSPLCCKIFPKEWYNLTVDCKKVIVDEVFNWDGHISSKDNHKSYSSNIKENADFIQFCIASSGNGSNIIIDDRNNVNYRVSFINVGYSSISNTRNTKRNFDIKKGLFDVYCFKVSTGFFICRRNNKIFVTGNCGEGHISKVLESQGYIVKSTDIVDRGFGEIKDFLFFNDEKFDGDIITNPPYAKALEFVKKALEVIPEGNKVSMLLRIQFLEGKERKRFFEKHPPKTVYVFSERIKCAINGDFNSVSSSAMAFCWFVWVKGYRGDTIIKWI